MCIHRILLPPDDFSRDCFLMPANADIARKSTSWSFVDNNFIKHFVTLRSLKLWYFVWLHMIPSLELFLFLSLRQLLVKSSNRWMKTMKRMWNWERKMWNLQESWRNLLNNMKSENRYFFFSVNVQRITHFTEVV